MGWSGRPGHPARTPPGLFGGYAAGALREIRSMLGGFLFSGDRQRESHRTLVIGRPRFTHQPLAL